MIPQSTQNNITTNRHNICQQQHKMAPNNRLPRDFVPAATQLSLSAFRFLENGTQIVASDQLDQEDCCPLCLESCTDIIDADAGPILRTNTCNHIICSPCLSKYVHSARRYCDSCPLCRAKLFERDMRLVDDLHVDQNFGNQPSHQQQLREELRVWARIQRDEARRIQSGKLHCVSIQRS